MGYEVSAGVILFRARPHREFLILDYGSHWDFPKGHIEEGEDPVITARRELREETGIEDARIVSGFLERMRYHYRRAGQPMQKVVIYFLAETTRGEVELSHEHCDYAWVPYEDAVARLTFKTAKDILTKAHNFLQTSHGRLQAHRSPESAK